MDLGKARLSCKAIPYVGVWAAFAMLGDLLMELSSAVVFDQVQH